MSVCCKLILIFAHLGGFSHFFSVIKKKRFRLGSVFHLPLLNSVSERSELASLAETTCIQVCSVYIGYVTVITGCGYSRPFLLLLHIILLPWSLLVLFASEKSTLLAPDINTW